VNDFTLVVGTAVRPLRNGTWRLLDLLVAAFVLANDRKLATASDDGKGSAHGCAYWVTSVHMLLVGWLK